VVFGSEGGAFWLPLALATIYGLSVATILTLVIVPVLYSSAEGGKGWLAALPGRVVARWNRRQPGIVAMRATGARAGD
jgi:Cu/Ag efflux pump CusA